jgi:predicted nucleotidyltransferase
MSDAQLELAAGILGPLTDDVIFVGGATVHLWISEPGAPPVRATDDVDVICDVQSRVDYYELAERLRERELLEALNEPVVGRWRHKVTGLAIDVIPITDVALGFTNPWYGVAIATAAERALISGRTIRAVVPPVLVATKLAAWRGRGRGDILRSLDVHDILLLVDGRPELADEFAAQAQDICAYVALELAQLRKDDYFEYAVQDAVRGYGGVASQRATLVLDRLNRIAASLESKG